jgi:hypothetical protein
MRKHSDRIKAGTALVVVLVVLAIGFHRLGPRSNQRAIRADERRVEDLRSIEQAMYSQNRRKMPMPATLTELPDSTALSLHDPVTNLSYGYVPESGTAYELCATFDTKTSARNGEWSQPYPAFWSHPKGAHCYQLEASQTADY